MTQMDQTSTGPAAAAAQVPQTLRCARRECKAANTAGAEFCRVCGAPLPQVAMPPALPQAPAAGDVLAYRRPADRAPARQKFSLTTPLVYLLLCTYFVIVVFPMFWLFYSSFKPDREIFLHPFELPDFKHAGRAAYDKAILLKHVDPAQTSYHEFAVQQVFINFSTAWVGGNFQ